MTQLVKFWMGNISFTSDFTGLSKEEIEKEFIEWLIDKSDAGWEVLEGEEKKEISLDEIFEEDLIPSDGNSCGNDDFKKLWLELWSE